MFFFLATSQTNICKNLFDSESKCPSAQVMWGFDTSSGACKEFKFGGCFGNRNRLPSKAKCEDEHRKCI